MRLNCMHPYISGLDDRPRDEKQTSRIQSLYLYFIKIVPFWLRNIRFLIQNTRSLFYWSHYSSLHRLMSLHRKLNVKIFLMFIVAENNRSVNIIIYIPMHNLIYFSTYFAFPFHLPSEKTSRETR